MTPEIIAILAVGVTLIALLLALWRDAPADTHALREKVRADCQSFREESRAVLQNFREEVRRDVAALRKDVQALTEPLCRVEGVIEGLFAGRDRHHDAA